MDFEKQNFLLILDHVKKEKLWETNWFLYEFFALVGAQILIDRGHSLQQTETILARNFFHFKTHEIKNIVDVSKMLSGLAETASPALKPGDKVSISPDCTGERNWLPGLVIKTQGGPQKNQVEVLAAFTGQIFFPAINQLKRINRINKIS